MTNSHSHAPEVSILVPNWNGGEVLGRCLSALQLSARRARISHELLVVDDASEDGSAALIKKRFPRVRLFRNFLNVGFARSVNRAAKAARGRLLLLANNDLVATEPFVGELTKWFRPGKARLSAQSREKKLFAVSARTVAWYDGTPNQLCMGAVWRGGRLTPAWSDPKTPARCLFVQAGAAIYDRAMFLKLGGMSLLYEPAYWEDYDLSWRAARRGWEMLYDPDALGLHHGGGSMTRRYGPEGVRLLRARNHLLFEAVHLRDPRYLAAWAGRLPVKALRELPRSEHPLSRALAAALPRMPQAIRERTRVAGRRTDREILAPFRDFTPS